MHLPGISVIICCYNSAEKLPETIKHIALQKFSNPWELIIVDNLSTDNSAEVAKAEWETYGLALPGFSVVKQNTPGLNHARQKGVEQAQYEYLIFCDDDNRLNDDYLDIAWQIITANNNIGAVGGQGIPQTENETPWPQWFENCKNNYAVGTQANVSGDVTARGYLWGAGLITSKTVFTQCFNDKFPALLTDREGNNLSSGGDTEMCSRMIIRGYRLYYDERLILKHFIPASRLTLNYLNELLAGFDAAHVLLLKYYHVIHIQALNRGQKMRNGLKSLVRLLASPFVKKWDASTEKQLFYLYTHINLGVDEATVRINKFKDGFA
jgi:glycosyltransferase involved in cell wall biosynthesis